MRLWGLISINRIGLSEMMLQLFIVMLSKTQSKPKTKAVTSKVVMKASFA